MKHALILLTLFFMGCAADAARTADRPAAEPAAAATTAANAAAAAHNQPPEAAGDKAPTPARRDGEPRTVREFFALLPDKYFTLEGCDRAHDKNCDRARAEFLKTFLQIEDAANGYLKTACDGAQSCLTMALFKRPDGSYLVGVNTSFEMGDDYYFLDYAGGRWTDVTAEVVPEFSKRNMYELPRYGTTVKVYAKKIIEEGPDFMASERGAHLYDLEWKNGKFAKK